MKNLGFISLLAFVFVGTTKAELVAPKLLTPENNTHLSLDNVFKSGSEVVGIDGTLTKEAFTWEKVVSAKQYRLIFSSDDKFSTYDAKKSQCLKSASCFISTVNELTPYIGIVDADGKLGFQIFSNTITKSLPPKRVFSLKKSLLKTDGKYFWQVQVIGKTTADNSKTGEIRSFVVGNYKEPIEIYPENQSIGEVNLSVGQQLLINVTNHGDGGYEWSLFNSIDKSLKFEGKKNFHDTNPPYLDGDAGTDQFIFTAMSAKQNGTIKLADKLFWGTKAETVISVNYSVTNKNKYVKIANDGSELPDTAKLGAGKKSWACTKDNETGLIWELKTTDRGLHNLNNRYTNYLDDFSEKIYKAKTNTFGFVIDVNDEHLCGKNNWRLPTDKELMTLVYCSDGRYNPMKNGNFEDFICTSNTRDKVLTIQPVIDVNYFTNTAIGAFWSSSTLGFMDSHVFQWVVDFGNGYNGRATESYEGYVRLVSDK